ncbi:MAG: helix-turn-helix domain-containing protein [Bacteroidetes bacterium]|nr:helix-turn-helix domain-containing protein [Bacteroidota bacterium]
MLELKELEDFYKTRYGSVPDSLHKEPGQFNVFRLEPFLGNNARPLSYRRSDYYKISLAIGKGTLHYADKSREIKKYALVFSDPNIPYTWEESNGIKRGYFCIFTHQFLYQLDNINHYPVFQPNGNHVFELTKTQMQEVKDIFEEMTEEINSDYPFKYDLLHNLVFRLIHKALKIKPDVIIETKTVNSLQRITGLFFDLLERQFPIDEQHQTLELHSASDFASQLNIHVNYLNRAIKDSTGKTTSQIVIERIFQEAKILLKQTQWSVLDIAFALDFKEVTHFNNFFKKYADTTPLKFRNA